MGVWVEFMDGVWYASGVGKGVGHAIPALTRLRGGDEGRRHALVRIVVLVGLLRWHASPPWGLGPLMRAGASSILDAERETL